MTIRFFEGTYFEGVKFENEKGIEVSISHEKNRKFSTLAIFDSKNENITQQVFDKHNYGVYYDVFCDEDAIIKAMNFLKQSN